MAPELLARSPWAILDDLRTHLQTSGPVTGRFEQTYVPAGFESGDRESGHLSIWLPDCLRWNYEEPEAKSFLICQGQVWFWNEGEDAGRKMQVEPESEPGLDLLLLPTDRLRDRYVAEARELEDGSSEIVLETPPTALSPLSARLVVDAAGEAVELLEFTDAEGNRSVFRISELQPLRHTALFQPPVDMEWIEE